MTRLIQCMTNLQDPSIVNQHGGREFTFSPGDDYVRWPAQAVAQSGGIYAAHRELVADLKAVGGSVELNGYRLTLLPRGAFGNGPAELKITAL